MKTLVSAVAVALACTFTLVGCGSSDSGAPSESAAKIDDEKASEAGATELSGSGSAEDPYSLGNVIETDVADIVVNDFTANGTDAILKHNSDSGFNTDDNQPDKGKQYALVNITIKQKTQYPMSILDLKFAFITPDGQEHGVENEKMIAIPDPVEPQDLAKGESSTGNVIIEIPAGQEGRLRVAAGPFSSDEKFFLTS